MNRTYVGWAIGAAMLLGVLLVVLFVTWAAPTPEASIIPEAAAAPETLDSGRQESAGGAPGESEVVVMVGMRAPGGSLEYVQVSDGIAVTATCDAWPQLVRVEGLSDGVPWWVSKQDVAGVLGVALDSFDELPSAQVAACRD